MKRALLIALGLLAALAAAFGQSPPFPASLPSRTFVGNMRPTAAPAAAVPLSQIQAALSGGEATVSDASYSFPSSDPTCQFRTLVYTALTAARTVTLNAASCYFPGTFVQVLDRSGGASQTSTITLAPTGSDTINGANSSKVAINAAYGFVLLESDGVSKWTVSSTGTTRRALTGTTAYYVNGSSISTATCGPAGNQTCSIGSDANNCLSASTACLTLQRAINLVANTVDMAGNTAQIYLAHNTGTTNYNAVCAGGGPFVGTSVVFVIGDSASPTATVITDPNGGYGIQIKDGCTLETDYLKFVDSGSSNAAGHILVGGSGNSGHLDFNGLTFGAMTIGTQLTAGYLGTATATGTNTISGSANAALVASDGGVIDFGPQTVTVSGTPAFATAFAYIPNGGVIKATNTTFSGAATGPRCLIQGPMNVGGFNPNAVFPGNSNCVANSYQGAIGLQTGSGGSSTFAYGSSGQCLTSGGGSSSLNTWANCAGAGVPQNNLNTQTANYTILTTDCGKTIQAGTGSTGLFTVTLPVVAGFASNCVLDVYNGDTLRGKILSGFPIPLASTPNNILWAGDTIQVGIVNGAWAVLAGAARHRIVASTTLFVDNTNGNDSNDCLAATINACKTIQGAISYLQTWDGNAQTITISVATGTYTNAVTFNGPFHGNPTVTLQGDLSTPSNVIISTTSASAITATNAATVSVGGFKLTTASAGFGIQSLNGSFVTVNGAMEYGATVNAHLSAGFGAVITVTANYTISGNAPFHWNATQAGSISASSITVTTSGTPAFATAFVRAINGGQISTFNDTFSGTGATGTRFSASLGGVIFTNQTSATYFPGNAAGTVASGGRIDGIGTPSVSSCGGGSPAVTAGSTDFSGSATEGTTASACTITFASGSTMKSCTVSLSTGNAVGITTLGSTLVVAHSSLSSNVLYWNCAN